MKTLCEITASNLMRQITLQTLHKNSEDKFFEL